MSCIIRVGVLFAATFADAKNVSTGDMLTLDLWNAVTDTIQTNIDNIGTRVYTAANYVVNGESLSSSIDKLDVQAKDNSDSVDAIRLARNEGLVVKYVTATSVDIDASYLTLFDSGNLGKVLSNINLTADISNPVGVNGLDVGTEAVSTWYHIWVINNGSTTSSLLSTSHTAPTMPAGYTYMKYVGAVYNEAGGSFRNFHQVGNDVAINKFIVSNYTFTTSWTPLSYSLCVPNTAFKIKGSIL